MNAPFYLLALAVPPLLSWRHARLVRFVLIALILLALQDIGRASVIGDVFFIIIDMMTITIATTLFVVAPFVRPMLRTAFIFAALYVISPGLRRLIHSWRKPA